MVHYHIPECCVRRLDCQVQGEGHSKGSKYPWMFIRGISFKPSVTKRGMVMYQQGLECHVKRLVSHLQSQGHDEDSYNQDVTVSAISSKVRILLQPNLLCWYIIMSLSI